MVTILERFVSLRFDPTRPLHMLMAQLPAKLIYHDFKFLHADPKQAERMVLTILEMVAEGQEGLDELDFVILPEAAVPMRSLTQVLDIIAERFRPNTVTCFGLEHISLKEYAELLNTYQDDNPEAHQVMVDYASRNDGRKPVNCGVIAVKDDEGRFNCFLVAKTHPFAGEEFFDESRDLYRGRHFYFFRSSLTPFNFMPLICLDYIFRDLTTSNIQQIIERANELYFLSRQQLDLLVVIQNNPKPEHRAFWQVVNGFYGEYLACTPGVRNTVTCFCNTSAESDLPELKEPGVFGASSVIMSHHHKIKKLTLGEFSIDSFHDAPVNRLRFGDGTRLFHVSIAPSHEPDPRTSRVPMKVLGIFKPSKGNGWEKLSLEDVMHGQMDG